MLGCQHLNHSAPLSEACPQKSLTFGSFQTAGLWWRPQRLRTTVIPEAGGKQQTVSCCSVQGDFFLEGELAPAELCAPGKDMEVCVRGLGFEL